MEVTIWDQWVVVGRGLPLVVRVREWKERDLERSEGLGSIPDVPSLSLSFSSVQWNVTHSSFRSC